VGDSASKNNFYGVSDWLMFCRDLRTWMCVGKMTHFAQNVHQVSQSSAPDSEIRQLPLQGGVLPSNFVPRPWCCPTLLSGYKSQQERVPGRADDGKARDAQLHGVLETLDT
jgi:hypothetical protein